MTPTPNHSMSLAAAVCGLLCAAATAQKQVDPAAAEAALSALESEYQQLREQILSRYGRATAEERQKLPDVNLWPREQIMSKVAQAAKRFAGTPAAVPFHLWIVRDSRRLADTSLARESVDCLLLHHLTDERLESVAAWLPRFAHRFGGEETLSRLERLRTGTASIDVQAACMLAQASVAFAFATNGAGERAAAIKAREEELKRRLREVIAFAPDTASGHRAERRLFEVEHLQVGCTAPDISGIDLDGVAFKLSDYRGKVVFLDFWGDW